MAIKLTPLSEAFPDSELELNVNRSHMFAHAGINYLEASIAAHACHETHGLNIYAPLPLMHQAIELLLKAHVSMIDTSFDPKKYGHETVALVNDYESKIGVFSTISANQECMELIAALEQAWLSVRYAEVVVSYTGPDYNTAGNIANLLADEYFREFGVPLMAHHFEEGKSTT